MSKLTSKIAIPIILAGLFTIIAFVAVGYELAEPVFYIMVLLLAFFVFFFGLAVGQNLSSPVKKILNGATELSEGNLSSRVYLETKDELAELAKVFNKIAEELEASHALEANTEKAVGIKVAARTKDLEETIDALEQKVKNRTIELERLMEESASMQKDVESKREETIQLKKELNDFKQRISKYNKPKQGAINTNSEQ